VTAGHPQRWWALGVLCLTLGMVALDNSILNVALPHIRAELGASERDLQWITTAYSLVLAGALLPFAVVGDRHGRKLGLVGGLAIFGGASLAASMATSAGMLVLCRGAMGVGGACAMPATLSLLGNLFDEHERPKAIAIWSAGAGVASACGPIVGGLLLSRFWWGSVFLVNVPVAIALLLTAVVLVPESRDPTSPTLDRRSAIAWWAALTSLLVAIIELPARSWHSPLVLGAAAAAVVLFRVFRRQEARTDGPLVDAATASDPRMLAGSVTMGALFLGIFGCQFVLTQWLQGPRGLSAVAAGACFVPGATAAMVLSLVGPRFARKHGHAAMAVTGLALSAVGAVGVSIAVIAGNVPAAALLFMLLGAGAGVAAPSGTEMIMSSAPPARAGSAGGVNETIVEASGALGVAVLGSILAGTHSYAWPLPAAAAVAATAALTVRARATRRRQPAPTP